MDGSLLLRRLRRRRYLALLISLLLLAILHPMLAAPSVNQGMLSFFLSLVFLAAIFAVGQKRRPFLGALALGIPALAVSWIAYTIARLRPDYANVVMLARDFNELLFLGFAIGVVLYDVLGDEEVGADKLCGAMCGYLMIGVAFAALYSMLDLLQPDSFLMTVPENGDLDSLEPHGMAFSTRLYYSFITLTTVGFGDIIPVTTAARTFSWLEAVCGQLYLAILIARLVGLHIATTKRAPQE